MKHQTNWNKTLDDPDNYPSSWDWTAKHSEYHFDDSVQDNPGDWFDVIGTFEGDWSSERDALVAETHPVNWATRKHYGGLAKEPPMLTQEEYDIQRAGGDPRGLTLTNKNTFKDWNKYPTLKAMMDYFGLEVGWCKWSKTSSTYPVNWDKCLICTLTNSGIVVMRIQNVLLV